MANTCLCLCAGLTTYGGCDKQVSQWYSKRVSNQSAHDMITCIPGGTSVAANGDPGNPISQTDCDPLAHVLN